MSEIVELMAEFFYPIPSSGAHPVVRMLRIHCILLLSAKVF